MQYRVIRPQPHLKAERLHQRPVMPLLHLLFLLSLITAVLSGASGAWAQAPDPAAVVTQEQARKLDQERVALAREYLRDNPISPPDTSSPRATLESFVYIMHEVNTLWMSVRDSYDESNRLFLSSDEKEKLVLVQALLSKAAQTFDLSDIPVTSREKASVEIALQLQEILDRIPPLHFEDIPGSPAGGFSKSGDQDRLPDHWTIPGTSISLMRQGTGEQHGQYLFSKASVERIPEDYAVVRVLPIKADKGEDLFEYYIYTPGNLVAPLWYDVIEAGPAFLHRHFADQAYWQWLALIGLFALTALVLGYYVRWRRMRAVSVHEGTRIAHAIFNPILVILAASLFRYLCEDQINITGMPLVAIGTSTTAIIWSATAWMVYQILQLFYVWFSSSSGAARDGLDVSLLRTGFRVFSLGIALIVLGYGATQIGIPIYGVIAGLGVGGLAIALAAQPTIENLIGGIILYADRMVRVGEFCQFDDLAGTVESIGIRSTRIRALDRTLITVANADLAKRKIINYSYRDQFHFRHKLGLRYETSQEALKRVLAGIHDYLKAHEKVAEDPMRVRLIGFDDYAVTVDVYAYVQASDMAGFLEIQEELLFGIREIVESNGSEIAYPSSTVYLSQDGGVQDGEAAGNGSPVSDDEKPQAA